MQNQYPQVYNQGYQNNVYPPDQQYSQQPQYYQNNGGGNYGPFGALFGQQQQQPNGQQPYNGQPYYGNPQY